MRHEIAQRRHDRRRRERDQRRENHANGDDQRNQIVFPQRARFALLVRDIQGGDDRARTIACAIKRNGERDDEADAFLAFGGMHDPDHLIAEQLGDVGGKDPEQRRHRS